jgi:multidrug efflux pump subunit AcrB
VQTTGGFNAVQQIQNVTVGRVATQSGGRKLRQPLAIVSQAALADDEQDGGLALPLATPLSQNVPVRLKDLDLEVKRDYLDPPLAITRFSDTERSYPCLVITFTMKDGVNIVDMNNELSKLLDSANETFLPPDIKLVKVSDQPVTVDNKVAEVSSNVISSIAVVIVVLVFMAGLRTATIAAIAIPAIMLITIGLMRFWHIDIEQVSLAALIVAVGILVDNTIQVSDNTQKSMDSGLSPTDAAIEGPNQIGFSIFIATCTILAVFIPMVFCLTGGMQEYARSLPMVVSLSLALGWLFAMTVTAIMAKHLLKPGGDINPLVWLKNRIRPQKKTAVAAPTGDGIYAKSCVIAVKARWVTLGLAYALAAAALMLLITGKVPGDFFPKSDRNQFVCDLFLPAGTPIQKTDKYQAHLERLIRGLSTKGYVDGKLVDLPDGEQRLENMASMIGTGGPYNFAGLFPQDGGSHYGIIWIRTVSGEQVPKFVQDIRRAAAEGIGQPGDPDYIAPIAGARVVPHQLISGVPVKSQIDVRLLGPRDGSEQILRKYGKRIADVVRESGLAWDVHTSWGEFTRQLDVEVDQDKANLAGVTNASLLLSLNAFYSGHPMITMREGDKQIPVMLRLPPEQRGTLDELDAVFVEGLTGKVPLNSIAKIERRWVNGKIHRNQRARCFSIGAEPEKDLLFSQVLEGIQPQLDEISTIRPTCRVRDLCRLRNEVGHRAGVIGAATRICGSPRFG